MAFKRVIIRRVGPLSWLLDVMKLKLAEAYESLLLIEKLTGTLLIEREFISLESKNANKVLESELLEFNTLVQQLVDDKDSLDLDELKSRLVVLRVSAINIATDFDNFSDAVAKLFVQTRSSDV